MENVGGDKHNVFIYMDTGYIERGVLCALLDNGLQSVQQTKFFCHLLISKVI